MMEKKKERVKWMRINMGAASNRGFSSPVTVSNHTPGCPAEVIARSSDKKAGMS